MGVNEGGLNKPQIQKGNHTTELGNIDPKFGDDKNPISFGGTQNNQMQQNNSFNQFGFGNFKPGFQAPIQQPKTDELLMDFGPVKQQQNMPPQQSNMPSQQPKNQSKNTIDDDFLSF